MTNQTPHTPTTQTPSPSGRGLGRGLQIRLPVITKELQEAYNNIKKVSPKAMAILQANEKRKEELERQQKLQSQQEFIEHNWIKLETQNLWKPTHPKIQILKQWDKIIDWIPYCWNDWNDWYYNWYAAMLESKHLWKRLPTDPELSQLFGSNDEIQLTKQEFQELTKKLNLNSAGLRNSGTFNFRGGNALLWTSTEYDTTGARGRYLYRNNAWVYRNYRDKSPYGFSVRCIKD